MVTSYILISTSWSSFSCLHITVTQSLGLGLERQSLGLGLETQSLGLGLEDLSLGLEHLSLDNNCGVFMADEYH